MPRRRATLRTFRWRPIRWRACSGNANCSPDGLRIRETRETY
jgi:hypothetical protein